MKAPRADETARQEVRGKAQRSFAIEAGAGTGKTTLLIDRIEHLIRSGHAGLLEIAAVTFTENAAGEMKLRLRERLEGVIASHDTPKIERRRAEQALAELDRATVTTLHSLCSAILAERPFECGVVPGFRVADEVEADALFEQAWQEWLTERLQAHDAVLRDALERCWSLDSEWVTAERKTLRGLARALADHRDLTPLVAKTPIDARRWRSELEDKTQRARALLSGVDEGDTLAHALRELLAFAATTRDLEGEALIERLVKMPMIPKRRGRKDCWPSEARLEDARALALWTQERCAQWQADQGARLYSRLAETLQGVGRRYAAIKQAAGVLDFLDLLIETERALKTRASLRQAFSQRYRIVIVDEFQDTDPIQVEIVRLIAGTHPGGLVIVGDAKQSIYRFRRAEVALFHRLAEEMRARPQSAVVHLTRNFRSRPALLRFVNRVFAELIQESEELGQPAYEPITPAPSIEDAPALIAVEFEAPAAKGRDLVEKEARALAHCLRAAANGCLQVRDPATQNPRASRASDVMVLARRLSHVEVLEQALDAAKIRFVLLGGKSFFDRQEVRETLHLLKAIADPTDRYALTAALRSICLGVSDADLVAYALAGGELRVGALDPNLPGAKALAPALELIERLHARREVDSIALLIERLFEETRMRALLTCSPRGEAQIANLEQVVMLARRLDGTSVLSLRGFIALLEQRVREGCQEADWPATRLDDPDTVRILTIHRAKGLEAPIVALFDSADEGTPKVDVVALRDSGQVALGFRADCAPPDWEALKEQEEARLKAEMHRLQYVACTRARDFLILPRPQGGAEVGDFLGELVQALPRQPAADIIEHVASLADEYGGHETPASDEEAAPVDTRVWEDTRRELIAQAGYQAYRPIAATQYARAQSVEQTVLSRSADTTGLEYGSLVHAVLEWIPFANVDEREIAKLTAALAPRHGLPPAAAARAANEIAAVLRLPIVAQAAHAQRVYRELPIALPEDGQLIEGVVDLVFEDNGRWIVIDYKTDRIAADQALAQAAHHAAQLRLYGRALTLASGRAVEKRLVIFTSLSQAIPV